MELWIRSQDKEKLVKVDEIYIEEILSTTVYINDRYRVGEWLVECSNVILGTYRSKERALEVLNDIQDTLIAKYVTSLNPRAAMLETEEETTKALEKMAVYVMPKE